ncbi:MAG: tRNA epoxyqueuosine(34) reductase QueG [Planctomycetes bacterium]|nr:tRNA epoxyqueuosine(34) reductase QueG [Planctomycetota bacterium]
MNGRYDLELTQCVRKLAIEAGFARVGIALAGPSSRDEALSRWLAEGRHAGMVWMARNLQARRDPGRLIPWAKSVICLAAGYRPADEPAGPEHIARFARGRDYHKILSRRCRALCDRIRAIAPEFSGRSFVDSGPVMERSLAALAGLGWIGRNGCLVCPGLGSYVLLCEIICNLPLKPDGPLASGCGDCGRCVRACPTAAIAADATVDARRCISYLTVEHSGDIGTEMRELVGCRVFGCDACQEACPHNRCGPTGDAELIRPHQAGLATLDELLAWDEEKWDAITRGSALRRADFQMLLRNAAIAAGNSGRTELLPILEKMADRHPRLATLISWAEKKLSS